MILVFPIRKSVQTNFILSQPLHSPRLLIPLGIFDQIVGKTPSKLRLYTSRDNDFTLLVTWMPSRFCRVKRKLFLILLVLSLENPLRFAVQFVAWWSRSRLAKAVALLTLMGRIKIIKHYKCIMTKVRVRLRVEMKSFRECILHSSNYR